MMNMTAMGNWRRVGAFAGLGFVILFVVALIIAGDTPMTDDSPADIREYFSDNDDQYMVADFFYGIAFVFFFLPFASALTAYLSAAEGSPAVWSWLVIIAAAVLTAAGGAVSGLQGAIAYGGGGVQSDELLVTLVHASYYTFITVLFLSTSLIALATGLVILSKGAFWSWLGWLSLAYVIAAMISYFTIFDDDPTGPLGILGIIVSIAFLVWMLVVSYGMVKQEPTAAAVTQPSMA